MALLIMRRAVWITLSSVHCQGRIYPLGPYSEEKTENGGISVKLDIPFFSRIRWSWWPDARRYRVRPESTVIIWPVMLSLRASMT